MYAQDVRELNSVSGRRSSRVDERIKRSVLFASVAVNTLQVLNSNDIEWRDQLSTKRKGNCKSAYF